MSALVSNFRQFQVFNDIGDTVIVCLGADCFEPPFVCRPDEVTVLNGTSCFWSTRPRAGLTWNQTATWTTPPQYGIFHGTPELPEYTFGIPPQAPPGDPDALSDWLRTWVSAAEGNQEMTSGPLDQSPPDEKIASQVARHFASLTGP